MKPQRYYCGDEKMEPTDNLFDGDWVKSKDYDALAEYAEQFKAVAEDLIAWDEGRHEGSPSGFFGAMLARARAALSKNTTTEAK